VKTRNPTLVARLSFPDLLYAAAVFCLVALIALCVAWELWLAPLRAGGSWMVLKALPLLAPLLGILHRRLYTYRWSAMLALVYFVEGAVRTYAESGLSAALAAIEIALALLFFAATIGFVRVASGPNRASRAS
jgi:uncharacterized membrane protein